jgi:serine/tyrosine/threonine adenylyltransferase
MGAREVGMSGEVGWRFDNSYGRLPQALYVRQAPTPTRAPRLVILNRALAQEMGLNPQALEAEEGVGALSGARVPAGADPLAQAYAGHQFGHFAMLGDGRAILLGEQITPSGARVDIHLKGGGQTAFSRRGDGRAALGPMLREHIISEAMHALGIPTTRSLAVTLTGEPVYRQTPQAGAVLARVAASHIRVGTFAFAARDEATLRALADYTIARHDPACLVGHDSPYLPWLRAVIERQAALVARWLMVGFIHGVMNTDNMAISGETIDYGPCAFMDAYDPATVFSSIDHQGRYAYGNQPQIAQWNLARFAEAVLPLLHPSQEEAIRLAEAEVKGFGARFSAHWLAGMRAKLGLLTEEGEDEALAHDLLAQMHAAGADYTLTFRGLAAIAANEAEARSEGSEDAEGSQGLGGAQALEGSGWSARWRARLARQPQPLGEATAQMRAHNPVVIPRNHMVERALAAAERGDMAPLQDLVAAVTRPFEDVASHAPYRGPAPPSAARYQTFCGT